MQAVIDLLAAGRAEAATRAEPTLAELRAVLDALGDVYPMPADVRTTEVVAGGVPAVWLEPPEARSDRVLLYLHGGGYQTGSRRSHGELAARLGRAASMRVLLPDYRLAPEHPFPAAVDDAVAVWHWLRRDQGLPASSMAVAGDSAGGGLAAALLVALRDAGDELPGAAVLLSPWADLTCSSASMSGRAGEDPVLTRERLGAMAADYLDGTDARHPLASPLFAPLGGLPPMLIQVGTAEILLDDARGLAQAAAAAGVDVEADEGEGLPHVYQIMSGTPEAEEASIRIGEFLRARVP